MHIIYVGMMLSGMPISMVIDFNRLLASGLRPCTSKFLTHRSFIFCFSCVERLCYHAGKMRVVRIWYRCHWLECLFRVM